MKDLQRKEENLFAVQHTTVHKAAFDGYLPGLKYFLKKLGSKRMNEQDRSGFCPIHYSAERGHSEAIEFLVDHGVDVNTLSSAGLTPLMCACRSGKSDAIRTLIRLCAHLMTSEGGGNTAAHLAAAGDFPEALACLLEGAQDRRVSHLEAIQLQAQQEADPNYVPPADSTGNRGPGTGSGGGSTNNNQESKKSSTNTPSAAASKNSKPSTAAVSVSQAASGGPDKSDKTNVDTKPVGKSGSSWSLLGGVLGASKVVVSALPAQTLPVLMTRGDAKGSGEASGQMKSDNEKVGPGISAGRTDATSASSLAQAQQTSSNSTKAKRKNTNAKSMAAKPDENPKSVPPALEMRVIDIPLFVIDAPANNGFRPLHMAANVNAYSSVSYLISVGVDFQSVDSGGDTALHKAARRNFFETYRVLRAAGAREDVKNTLWETPAKLMNDACYL